MTKVYCSHLVIFFDYNTHTHESAFGYCADISHGNCCVNEGSIVLTYPMAIVALMREANGRACGCNFNDIPWDLCYTKFFLHLSTRCHFVSMIRLKLWYNCLNCL